MDISVCAIVGPGLLLPGLLNSLLRLCWESRGIQQQSWSKVRGLRRMGEERGVSSGVEPQWWRWYGLASRSLAGLANPNDSQSAARKER